MQTMRISIVQSKLHWESPSANQQMFAQKLADLKGKTDLVVLPEMFTTGFSVTAKHLSEPMDGPTIAWMKALAKDLDAGVVGSFNCTEEGRYFNRLVFMRPDGTFDFYDKKHLFSLTNEHEHFNAGRKRLTLEWRGWRFCPLICYDLRFPAWSRNIPGDFISGLEHYYEVLIFVANWPVKRAHQWKSLLTARAIENQSFAVGVNIVGTDGNGLEYSGDSTIVDYSGQPLVQLPNGVEDIKTIELSKDDLIQYRQQLPFLADADRFEFKG